MSESKPAVPQWAVMEADNATVHVVPVAEQHQLSERCHCQPAQDRIAEVWIHRRKQ